MLILIVTCALPCILHSPAAQSLSSIEAIAEKGPVMYAKVLIGLALLVPSLAAVVTPSASHLDPTITPGPNIELFRKQNNDRYMGWVSNSGTWLTQQCEPGVTYFQSGGHWRCCATTSAGCDIPQACVNGNLIFDFSTLGIRTSLTRAWCVTFGAKRS